ncbi:hypothetical protein PWT90_03589 [Aphanocladium album]|nr:hypothetical protein PWT90_03589 [Aphanocladium album]
MSAEAASDSEGEAPYPSLEERQMNRQGVGYVPETQRIYWPLEGVFPAKIAYMTPTGKLRRMKRLEDLEPLYQHENDTWHEIASLPFTTKKVSSMQLSLRELDDWEWRWMDFHRFCSEEQKEYVTYGDLDDEDRPYRSDGAEDGNWEEDSDTEFLIKCCGSDRPLKKKGRSLIIRPAPGKTFVTIRDYLSTVDPWLMSMREDIIQGSEHVHWGGLDDTEWMVDTFIGEDIRIISRKAWVRHHGPLSPEQEAASAKSFELIKRLREAERAEKAAQNATEEQKEGQDSTALVSSESISQ